jgi:hypothetical protein
MITPASDRNPQFQRVTGESMPSTVVHLAFAGLLAAALLADRFDTRALAVVLVVVAVPDLDSFLFGAVGHRTVLHNVCVPLAGALALWVDTRVRSQSLVRTRWGRRGEHILWVGLAAYVGAHLGLDIADGYINLFWPVHDQFYSLDGAIELSNKRGIVQTFSDGGLPLLEAQGTTDRVEITTGLDPGDEATERLFPVVRAGWQLVVLLTGGLVTGARLWRSRGEQ